MRTHVLVFDGSQMAKGLVRDRINAIAEIENWTLFFGNTMCLTSKRDARFLSREIRRACPNLRFLLTTVDPDNKGGWLPKNLWSFINNPAAADTDVGA